MIKNRLSDNRLYNLFLDQTYALYIGNRIVNTPDVQSVETGFKEAHWAQSRQGRRDDTLLCARAEEGVPDKRGSTREGCRF